MMEKEAFEKLTATNGRKNLGWETHRLEFDQADLERSFSKKWQEENKVNPGINEGKGILQNLFFSHLPPKVSLFRRRQLLKITLRERMIVATVIQWLGTNCGFCWLNEVLKKAGYKIVKIEK